METLGTFSQPVSYLSAPHVPDPQQSRQLPSLPTSQPHTHDLSPRSLPSHSERRRRGIGRETGSCHRWRQGGYRSTCRPVEDKVPTAWVVAHLRRSTRASGHQGIRARFARRASRSESGLDFGFGFKILSGFVSCVKLIREFLQIYLRSSGLDSTHSLQRLQRFSHFQRVVTRLPTFPLVVMACKGCGRLATGSVVRLA